MEFSPGKHYSLEVLDGFQPGRVYPIEKAQLTLGRQNCDIHLQDPEISRRHATLTIDGETAVLEDLGSANGTYVEGVRIQKATLVDGTHFRMGTHQLVFRISDRKTP